jgi:hypothetical protein
MGTARMREAAFFDSPDSFGAFGCIVPKWEIPDEKKGRKEGT